MNLRGKREGREEEKMGGSRKTPPNKLLATALSKTLTIDTQAARQTVYS